MNEARSLRLPDLGPRGEGWVAAQFGLYALLAVWGRRGPPWPSPARAPLRTAAVPLGVAGTALVVAGSLALGRSITPNPRPREDSELRDHGVYGLVRHPIYGGVMMGAAAWCFWNGPVSLAPAVPTAWLLELKSRREEEWLLERHPGYAAYRRRVPKRFLPWTW